MNEFKCFVRVANTYAFKNKLCKLIIEELSTFDGTLFTTEESAKKALNRHHLKVTKKYLQQGGKAMLPNCQTFTTESGFVFYVEEAIYIHGYRVKKYVMEEDIAEPGISEAVMNEEVQCCLPVEMDTYSGETHDCPICGKTSRILVER